MAPRKGIFVSAKRNHEKGKVAYLHFVVRVPRNMGENCTDYAKLYNTTGFRIASAFTMAAGAITIICAVSTAVVIFASQSHRLYHFRLILYYCISAALFGLANCINRIDYAFASDPTRRDESCAGTGFVFQYAMWSLLISILSVTLSINVKMTLKRDLKGTEPASLFAAFVLPLLSPDQLDPVRQTGLRALG
ncbi:hypothetical protein EMCRGX_G034832 [Ephydatia muelleri]